MTTTTGPITLIRPRTVPTRNAQRCGAHALQPTLLQRVRRALRNPSVGRHAARSTRAGQ